MKNPRFNKNVVFIDKDEDFKKLDMDDVASGFCVPCISVSCKVGTGIDLLRKFMFLIPPSIARTQMTENIKVHEGISTKIVVDSKYLSKAHGIIIGGTVLQGSVKVGDQIMLGPDKGGAFAEVKINGIEEDRVPINEAGVM